MPKDGTVHELTSNVSTDRHNAEAKVVLQPWMCLLWLHPHTLPQPSFCSWGVGVVVPETANSRPCVIGRRATRLFPCRPSCSCSSCWTSMRLQEPCWHRKVQPRRPLASITNTASWLELNPPTVLLACTPPSGSHLQLWNWTGTGFLSYFQEKQLKSHNSNSSLCCLLYVNSQNFTLICCVFVCFFCKSILFLHISWFELTMSFSRVRCVLFLFPSAHVCFSFASHFVRPVLMMLCCALTNLFLISFCTFPSSSLSALASVLLVLGDTYNIPLDPRGKIKTTRRPVLGPVVLWLKLSGLIMWRSCRLLHCQAFIWNWSDSTLLLYLSQVLFIDMMFTLRYFTVATL